MIAMAKERDTQQPHGETKRAQINISPSSDTYENVKRLAEKYAMPMAEVAREIVKDCAEIWERARDTYRGTLALHAHSASIGDPARGDRIRALFFQYPNLSVDDRKTIDSLLDLADKVLLNPREEP
jgi:hypothetical protein